MELELIKSWLNNNVGFLNLILFFTSLFLGWISGLFRSILKRPKFEIRVIPKMTFGSVFYTGQQYTPPGFGTYQLHKTAFVLYLEITNIGSANSKLGKIKIGFHKDDGKRTWFKKRLWLVETNVLANFGIPTAEGEIIGIPHLRQSNPQIDQKYDGFLEVGNSIIGAAYFEFNSAWGNFYPRLNEKGETEIKIKVKDAFKNKYTKKVNVPIIHIEDALKYNPRFALTEHLLNKEYEDVENTDNKESKGGTINEEKEGDTQQSIQRS